MRAIVTQSTPLFRAALDKIDVKYTTPYRQSDTLDETTLLARHELELMGPSATSFLPQTRRDKRDIETLLFLRGQGDVHGLFNHLLLSGFTAPYGGQGIVPTVLSIAPFRNGALKFIDCKHDTGLRTKGASASAETLHLTGPVTPFHLFMLCRLLEGHKPASFTAQLKADAHMGGLNVADGEEFDEEEPKRSADAHEYLARVSRLDMRGLASFEWREGGYTFSAREWTS